MSNTSLFSSLKSLRRRTRKSSSRRSNRRLLGENLEGRRLLAVDFAVPPPTISSDHALTVAVGDFNNDGNPDLVAGKYTFATPFTVSVRLGDGAGDFGPATSIPVGVRPWYVHVADFNADGNDDIGVASGSYGAGFSVLLGDGMGAFEAPVATGLSGIGRMTTADLNHDGHLDVVLPGYNNVPFVLSLGDGSGGFTPATSLVDPQVLRPHAVALGDFNDDGHPDVAVAHDGYLSPRGEVTTFLGDGLGGVSSSVSVSVGQRPTDLTAADFNGDGIDDLAAVSVSFTSVLLADGSGGFDYNAYNTDSATAIDAGDFNLDGAVDIVMVSAFTGRGNTGVLLNDGEGGFEPQIFIGFRNRLDSDVAVADFNQDGKPDFVVASNRRSQFKTFMNLTIPANSPPSIAADAASVSVDEGGNATNTGTFSDAEGNDTVSLTASVGTVTKNDAAGTWSWSIGTIDGPADPIDVTITATDGLGAESNVTFSYSVDNVDPKISLSGNATVDEGSEYTLNLGVVTDPGADTITSYKIVWGDGTIDHFTGSPANTTAGHTYPDGPATQTHNVVVTDEDGTVIAGSYSVTVLNVAPTVAHGAAVLEENTSSPTYVGTVSATDPGADSVSLAITDGNTNNAFAIDEVTGDITVNNSAALDFETTPFFTLTVEATDSDGAVGTGYFLVDLSNVTAIISGSVFVDANQDGDFDGGSETGVDGVTITLQNLRDEVFEEIGTNETSMGGVYAFEVDDEFGTYRIVQTQPTGVDNGNAIAGSGATSSTLNPDSLDDVIQLTLGVDADNSGQPDDATDWDFSEVGQTVQAGDTATIGFWQNKNGKKLIESANGTELSVWLSDNFGNVFGTELDGASSTEVYDFYKSEFFKKKLKGSSKVDAQFMSVAFTTFFTGSNLSGTDTLATSMGFTVTELGVGAKVVNVGASGAAFDVDNDTDMTIMAMLLATNSLTGADNGTNDGMTDTDDNGYSNVYDANGDGVLDDAEKALRSLANDLYTLINEGGDR